MFSTLTLIMLWTQGVGVGVAPERLLAAKPPTHFTNYTLAYREAQRSKKPLLVILNPGNEAADVPVHLADVRKTEHRRKLLERYVVVVLDAGTKHGETTHKLFDSRALPHVSVIDHDQRWQLFRTSRKLQGDDWNKILETFQNGENTVWLNLDVPKPCPT